AARPGARPAPPGERIPRAGGGHRMPATSRQRGGRPPAKLALLTRAGAYAAGLLVLARGGPGGGGGAAAVRRPVPRGVRGAAMTWVIAPVVTRLFRGWLLR